MNKLQISIEDSAYAKIFMHAIKNSYDDVCGILIGKQTEENKKWHITNSIPLFHTHILSPFLTLAFTIVENYYKDKDEQIIGYYHISSEESKNTDIKNLKTCELVAEKLIKNYKKALVCLVELSKLEEDEEKCLHIFMKGDSSEWKEIPVSVSLDNKEFLKKNISNHSYLNICDFDDHLNCLSQDFMNPNLFNQA